LKAGKFFTISMTLVIVVILAVSCDQRTGTVDFNGYSGGDDSQNPQPSEPNDPFAATPRADKEAELMALWLSAEIMAPDSLYNAVDKGLKFIRGNYPDSIPCSLFAFKPEFIPSVLIVVFTDSLAKEYRAGNYHDWDSLNNYFRVQEIDTSVFLGKLSARLKFKGVLNPYHLEHIYMNNLPEMYLIDPDGFAGDWPNFYPWVVDNRLEFFLRDAWGDCPAGCLDQDVYAFLQNDGEYEYAGFHSDTLVQAKPLWWGDFREALKRFRRFRFYIDSLYR